jgi:lantibiotic modifying enzyme
MRSTWEYLVLLRASLEPNALLDANARELALGNIISTAHKWGGKEDGRRRLAIALSELDSIRALDIPEFYNLPLSSSVTDTSNLTVSGLLVGSAYHRLQGRLAAIDSFDLEKHLQVLRFAVTAIIRSPN